MEGTLFSNFPRIPNSYRLPAWSVRHCCDVRRVPVPSPDLRRRFNGSVAHHRLVALPIPPVVSSPVTPQAHSPAARRGDAQPHPLGAAHGDQRQSGRAAKGPAGEAARAKAVGCHRRPPAPLLGRLDCPSVCRLPEYRTTQRFCSGYATGLEGDDSKDFASSK
ncbi:hypothetical protein GUJ93_ZPchr0013g37468 [Zizania palustris]|uniref:Uncharacterized protein n=1 Tax=Zizania palustris TaxID=103762 RepID=A0A8J5WSN3_ZIZPA|nr:hypothetical protein GUJ93_ZPchr0013g37468 [Zizania palustris]